jgi:hypothetical protein
MAPKKKKKKKGKKKKEYDPPVYQIPIYEDPDVVTPKVELTIKHHEMEIPNDAMTLKISMLISAPVSRVAKAIARHHQESIQNVIICKDEWNEENALPHEFTLEKCGITGP